MLLSLSDDRPAPGDTILLTGTNLGSGSDTVVVHFDPSLTVPVATPNSQQISVVVPRGAKTGNVSVTVTHTMPDGTIVKQDSNSLPIMVIWKTFNADQFFAPQGSSPDLVNNLVHGEADDLYIYVENRLCPFPCDWGWSEDVHSIGHDGTVTSLANVYSWPGTYWGRVAVNPITKHVVAVMSSAGIPGSIVDFKTLQALWAPAQGAGRFLPCLIGFDTQGDLIVAGDDSGRGWGSATVAFWRFAPSDPIVLDPNNANSLVPGGLADTSWDVLSELAVGGDGTIYATGYVDWDKPWKLWRIPGRNGKLYDQVDLPGASGPYVYAGSGWWFLAADCRGEGYLINPALNGWVAGSPPLYRLSDMQPVTTVALEDPFALSGLNTDGFGNLYVFGWDNIITRITQGTAAGDLPPNFYCPLSQPAGAQAQARAAATIPNCGLCFPQRKLVVEIDGVIHEDGDKVQIPLGRKLDLKAWWSKPGSLLLDTANAQWSLDNVKPNWESEHADAAAENVVESQGDSERGVLFRDDVLLLFDEGSPDASVHTRTVWPIHNGTANLKLHAVQTNGQSADIAVHLTVTYDRVRVGQDPGTFDAFILKWANAFGFPPQYVKGVIKRESKFYLREYRYEPRYFDYFEVVPNLATPYFRAFRYAEPAESLVGPLTQGFALTQIDKDGRAYPSQGQALFSYDPLSGQCTQITVGLGDVTTWSLYLGSNGLTSIVGPKNPCFQRMHWDDGVDIYAWDVLPPSSPPIGHGITWWFATHKCYVAQMYDAASYGLMQVGYATDLATMAWFDGDADNRHWPHLIDEPSGNTNIYLGTRWLAWPRFRHWPHDIAAKEEAARHKKAEFDGLVNLLLCEYNGGPGATAGCGYDGSVVGFAAAFTPTF